jgi:hypothetical protein
MFLVSVSAVPAHSQSVEDDWFLAAQDGNTQKLVALLTEGVDVDTRGPHGETALMMAAGNGRTDSVRALLSAEAAVEAQAQGGLTALMAASANGDAEIVRMLIDSGADPSRRAENGAGPLLAAALGGPHVEAMRLLLREGAELEELVLALTHQESALRVRAVMALALLGSDAKSAVPSLAESLGDKNLNVRYWAASALKKIGPEARAAVPYLVEALKTHPDRTPALEGPPRYYADVRWVAAEALGEVGLATAVPALKAAVDDEHPQVRSAAIEALEKIEGRVSENTDPGSGSGEPVPMSSPSAESGGAIPAGPLPPRPDPLANPVIVSKRVAWTERTETAVGYEWHAVLRNPSPERQKIALSLRLHEADGHVIYQTEERVEVVGPDVSVELQGTGQVKETVALKGVHWTFFVTRLEESR